MSSKCQRVMTINKMVLMQMGYSERFTEQFSAKSEIPEITTQFLLKEALLRKRDKIINMYEAVEMTYELWIS